MTSKQFLAVSSTGLLLLCAFAAIHFTRPRPRLEIRAHVLGLSGIEYSSNGNILISIGHDHRAKAWSPLDGQLKEELQFGNGFSAVSLSAKSDLAALVPIGRSPRIVLWDFSKGPKYRLFDTHNDSDVICLDFSGDSDLLATGSADGVVQLCDVRSGLSKRAMGAHESPVVEVVFSVDGKFIVSASEAGDVWRWEPESDLQQPIIHAHQFVPMAERKSTFRVVVCSLAISPNSEMIAVGYFDGNVAVVDAMSGAVVTVLHCIEHNAEAAVNSSIRALQFSPCGRLLACGGADSCGVKLWNTRTWQLAYSFRKCSVGISSLAFSPDGAILAVGDFGGTIFLWGINSESERTSHGSRRSRKRSPAEAAEQSPRA